MAEEETRVMEETEEVRVAADEEKEGEAKETVPEREAEKAVEKTEEVKVASEVEIVEDEEKEEERKEPVEETEKKEERVMTATEEVPELPRAIVKRVVKEGIESEEMNVNKEALLAFSDSARIFIHYLSATANDICKESKRQTINANDVLKALEDMEFSQFIAPLTSSLQEYRNKNAAKRGATKGGKRKTEVEEEKDGYGPSKEDDSETKKQKKIDVNNVDDVQAVRTESVQV